MSHMQAVLSVTDTTYSLQTRSLSISAPLSGLNRGTAREHPGNKSADAIADSYIAIQPQAFAHNAITKALTDPTTASPCTINASAHAAYPLTSLGTQNIPLMARIPRTKKIPVPMSTLAILPWL